MLLETRGQQLMVGQWQTNQHDCHPRLRALNATPQGSSAPPSCAGRDTVPGSGPGESSPHRPQPSCPPSLLGSQRPPQERHSSELKVHCKPSASSGSCSQLPPAGQEGGPASPNLPGQGCLQPHAGIVHACPGGPWHHWGSVFP